MISQPLKRVADVRFSNVDKKSVDAQVDVRLCNYVDVYHNDQVVPSMHFMEATATRDQVARFELRSGDVLLTKDSETADDIGVSALVAEDLPGVLCGYHLALVRPNPALLDGRYLHWALVATSSRQQLEVAATGVTRFGLRRESVSGMLVPTPSLKDQRAIADYLDAETGRIDKMVLARRRMVDLLLERRSAFISATVQSGQPTRVRRVISTCTSGPRGWGDLVTDAGAMFIRSANLRRASVRIMNDGMAHVPPQTSPEANRSRVHAGDVLVAVTGANTGWVGVADSSHEGAFISQHVAVLRPANIEPEWLAYSIASDQGQRALLGSQYGGTKTQLGLDDLRELEIRVPSHEIQRAAVGDLTRIEVATQRTVDLTKRQIDLIIEHRQTLISAAVTGQFVVPGVAA